MFNGFISMIHYTQATCFLSHAMQYFTLSYHSQKLKDLDSYRLIGALLFQIRIARARAIRAWLTGLGF